MTSVRSARPHLAAHAGAREEVACVELEAGLVGEHPHGAPHAGQRHLRHQPHAVLELSAIRAPHRYLLKTKGAFSSLSKGKI